VNAERPLIAIVGHRILPSAGGERPGGVFGVPGQYIAALRRAGAATALLIPGEVDDPGEILEPFDGLLLAGGGDVEPLRYGATPRTEILRTVDPERDAFEIDLVLAANRMAMPTLCICRGMQVMNVAFGGTLHQHVPDLPGLHPHEPTDGEASRFHEVMVEPVSQLATAVAAAEGGSLARCWSGHHQAVDRLGDGLWVGGRSPDGLIEAIEGGTAEGWMLGVQWHPERTAADDPAQQALFDALVGQARQRTAGQAS
jgi:putative glutamine amidotransferase